MTRLFLDSSVEDHQCGFKAFDRDVILDLLPAVKDDHWFWDTEILVRAQRRGYQIKEFPVEWEAKEDSKVDLAEDIMGMGTQIIRRWWEFAIAPRITRRRTVLAGSLLLLFAVVVSPYYLDIEVLLKQFGKLTLGYILLASAVYLVSIPIRGIRYRLILWTQGEPISLSLSTGAIFISQTANFVIPARTGDAVRAYIIKVKQGISYPIGFASLVVERIFDLFTIVALSVLGTTVLLVVDPPLFEDILTTVSTGLPASRIGILVGGLVALVTVAITGVVVYSARHNKAYLSPLIERLHTYPYLTELLRNLQRMGANVQQMAINRRATITVLGLSVLIWGIDIATAVVIFQAVDVSIGLSLLVVIVIAVSVGNLAKVLPLTPGGIGLYEGVFTAFIFAVTSLSVELILAIALVDHAIKNGVTTAGGGISILGLNMSLSETIGDTKTIEPANETSTQPEDE